MSQEPDQTLANQTLANQTLENAGLTKIPQPTIERLSAYLQCVRGLRAGGVLTASSSQIAEGTGINAAQFRKDLSYFGEFGTPGLGYDVAELEAHLARIMGLDRPHDVLLVGAGNLGTALSSYPGFPERGFRIVAAFDTAPAKVGGTLSGCPIHHVDDLAKVNAALGAQVGIVAVPRAAAQEAVDKLVAAGVRSILNFAPATVLTRSGITVRHVDLTSQLEVLSYYLSAREAG
ncbi:MAG TPA: redox-sensing transcriptional repressor Rex [Abditibacteriaceae bacterium]|nr:redox-sensing transcriptional repressor Rex [Abditibacteriaceae bacterium]